MTKITLAEVRSRCRRLNCNHFDYLHGNGSRAHNNSTSCVMAGCTCSVFLVPPSEPKTPRPKPVKTLDQDEPKLFEPTQ
jgi:hypothetical protein